MPDFSLPEFSDAAGDTWSTIAQVATSDGTLVLAERYAGPDIFRLTYTVTFFDLNGREVDGAGYTYTQGDTSTNRQHARDAFLARVSDSLWS